MHILFFGQKGFPKLSERENASTEARVADVSAAFAEAGHQVTVFGTKPYLTAPRQRQGLITLHRLSSLDPRRPGGWFYLLAGVRAARRLQPGVIHVHGWQAAVLARLLPQRIATLIWTIDRLPKRSLSRWFVRFVAHPFTDVTVPTRKLQYQLLVAYGLRARYIPDGYTVGTTPLLALSAWRLRAESYSVVLAHSPQALRRAALAYKQTGSRQKLVVLQEAQGAYKRIGSQFKHLRFVGALSGRARRSLIAGARSVILADGGSSPTVVLEAMDAARAIVAVNHPLYQELLGVTAQFVGVKDEAGFGEALTSVVKDLAAARSWGRKARTRARRHFTQERIMTEYLSAYASVLRMVPVDSVRAVTFTQHHFSR